MRSQVYVLTVLQQDNITSLLLLIAVLAPLFQEGKSTMILIRFVRKKGAIALHLPSTGQPV